MVDFIWAKSHRCLLGKCLAFECGMESIIKKMIIFIAIIFIAVLVSIVQALRIPLLDVPSNASTGQKLQALDEWLELIHTKEKFNGVVLLSKQGDVIFSKSYGFNDANGHNQLTDHSAFNLASVSKQFTAMGVVILNQQSQIEYGDKISKYIPELSYYKEVTIQHLLHHTSGLPDYMMLAESNRNDARTFTIAEMVSLYGDKHPKLNFAPGSKFQYSNAGYVLLAEIIERVSGHSFQQFMTSHIFEPLRMNDTQVFNLLSEVEPENRVRGFKYKYGLFGGPKVVNDLNYFDGVAGDGGIYSSAHDLNIWHQALSQGVLVSNEAYRSAYVPAQLNDGSKTKYGFGWFVNEDKSVEHGGGWQGFSSFLYRNMEQDELIVILDNSSNTLRVNSIGSRFNSIGLNLKKFMAAL